MRLIIYFGGVRILFNFEKFDERLFSYDLKAELEEVNYVLLVTLMSLPTRNIDFSNFTVEAAIKAMEEVMHYVSDDEETYYLEDFEMPQAIMQNKFNLLFDINRNAHIYKYIGKINSVKRKFL